MSVIVTEALGVLGSAAVLSMIAAGLAVSFGLMRIINLAHGEFIMLGAYAGTIAVAHGIAWWIGLAIGSLVAGIAGAVAEITLIRRLYRTPELSILGTFGLSLMLRQTVEIIFGKDYRASVNPIPGATVVLGASFPTYRLILIVVAAVVLGALLALLYLARLGTRVRAVAADSALAETVGIRTERLNLLVFSASTALAGLAGALVAPLTTVQPGMGLDYLFDAFLVVIVGGSQINRVLAAALAVAAVSNATTYFTDPLTARLSVLALAFGVLVARRQARTGRVASTVPVVLS